MRTSQRKVRKSVRLGPPFPTIVYRAAVVGAEVRIEREPDSSRAARASQA